MQEVFLRLAAQNKGVNYTDTDFSTQEATPASRHRKCIVCNVRPPEPVTLFTAKGFAVELTDAICSTCSRLEAGAAVGAVDGTVAASGGAGVVGNDPSEWKTVASSVVGVAAAAEAGVQSGAGSHGSSSSNGAAKAVPPSQQPQVTIPMNGGGAVRAHKTRPPVSLKQQVSCGAGIAFPPLPMHYALNTHNHTNRDNKPSAHNIHTHTHTRTPQARRTNTTHALPTPHTLFTVESDTLMLGAVIG